MKENWGMAVRKGTVAPVLAAVFLVCMGIWRPYVFSGTGQWLYDLLTLGVFPLLAYPLQRYFPHFRAAGRRGQRILAMIFAVAGYVVCCLLNLLLGASSGAWIIVLEYLLSGVLIFLLNQICHLTVSGHACGVVGPVMLLFYFKLFVPAAIGILLTILVYGASLSTKRHTLPQLIGGSVVPAAVMLLLRLLLGAFDAALYL